MTIILIALMFAILPGSLPADTGEPIAAEFAFQPYDTIPLDPDIKHGKLDNGITYYIKTNPKPEGRAELRLVVNAGSVLENDKQQGLAHFLEHMAFNGTKNFEKQELVDFLESIGMRFGPDLNAYTSFDETVYMLQVPTDSQELVETSFQILEDWAHQLSLEEEEIDKERGVIVEEWRTGRGAQARMSDEQYPILFKGSRYAERLPIGKMDVVENFEYETLRQFYRDWYRPDLMAVVAVGDFDPLWIEQLIKDHFGKIERPANPPERELFVVPGHEETLFAIASDPEATNSSVTLVYKQPRSKTEVVLDYRQDLIEDLYNSMFNKRLYELSQQADPPFIYASSGQGSWLRTKDVYYISAGVNEGEIADGFEAILTEAQRVDRFGFTESELERQKKEMMTNIEKAYNERDKTDSRRYASQLVSHYLQDRKVPGIEYRYSLYKTYLDGITLDEVNNLAEQWISDDNRVVMVNSPEKEDLPIPSEEDLLAVFDRVQDKDLEPYEDKVSDEPLVENIPQGAEVVSEEYMDDIDVSHWTLANGVEVILKPTDFKNDEILMTAFSPGGSSLVELEDRIPAATAADLVNKSGVGDFDNISLQKRLAGQIVNVSPSISGLTEGISGSTTPKDMETMFKLIYLYFTDPRIDSSAYLAYINEQENMLRNKDANPMMSLVDTIRWVLSDYHPRAKPRTMEDLDEMDMRRSLEIYKDRFFDASDFTFIFVGNFELDQIRPHVQTYLGGLPSIDRQESFRDLGVDAPEGVVKKEVRKGIEPVSHMQLAFIGDMEFNRTNKHMIESLASALQIRLREVVREDLGGTYGTYAYGAPINYPDDEFRFIIGLGLSPDRVDELSNAIFTQLDSIKATGLEKSYIDKVKEMQRREYEENLKQNSFWRDMLYEYYWNKFDPTLIDNYDDLIELITPEAIQQAANQYLDQDRYVRIVLYPEKDKTAEVE